MAKSGKIVITQNSQNTSSNTSSVTIKCYITTSGDSWRGTRIGTININVSGSASTSEIFEATAPKNTTNHLILSKTFTVSHNTEGKCTVKASFNYDDGWVTASASKTLTTIPRASVFGTISGSTLGSSITINISRKVSSFTHNLYYRAKGTSTWTTIGTGIGISKAFTPPLSLASNIPNSTSLTLELLLRTYSGSTKIGSDVTKSITVNLPSSVIPTVNTPSLTRIDNGVPTSWGVYVKTYSKVTVKVSGSGVYGSTIKSYEITCNGEKKTGSSATFGSFNTSGTKTISVVAIDSRGRKSVAKTASIIVQDYAKPKLELVAYRSNSSGTKDSSGTYITIKPTYSCSSCGGKNSIVSKTFKAGNQTNTTLTSGSSITFSGFETTNEYLATGVVQDALGNSSQTSNIKILSSAVCFHIRTSKKGVGIGRYCTVENQLQTAYSIKADESIYTDYLLYTGGKTSVFDGKAGGTLGANGYLHLIADSSKNNPGIAFYFNLATASTHQLQARQNDFYLSKPVTINGNITSGGYCILPNNKYLLCTNSAASRNETIIGLSSNDNLVIGANLESSNIAGLYLYCYKGSTHINTNNYVYIGDNSVRYSKHLVFGGSSIGYGYEKAISTYCSDSNLHTMIQAPDNGRYLYVGFISSITSALYLRGNTIKLNDSSGATVTSDRNLKKDISEYDDRYDVFFDNLQPCSFRYWNGSSGRNHTGYVTQDVEDALKKAGLTTKEFAGVNIYKLSDSDREQENGVDIEGSHINHLLDNGIYEEHDLIYESFISLNTWQIQKLKNKVKEDEEIIESLQNQIDELKELVLNLKIKE